MEKAFTGSMGDGGLSGRTAAVMQLGTLIPCL